MWVTAKSSDKLRSILTHVHNGNSGPSLHPDGKNPTVQVEIVAQDGLKWIKLSTITANRLMLELAKAGWEGDREGDQSEQEEDQSCYEWNKSVILQVPLMQSAQHLVSAAKRTWVDYQHPKVVFQLQNVYLNVAPYPVRQLLEGLTEIGVTVQCADDIKASLASQSTPSVEELIHNLQHQRDSYADLTNTINLDCTVWLFSESAHTSSCL